MKHVRLFSLLTVLVFLLGYAYAQKLPPTVKTPLVVGVPEEDSGIQHAAHSTGPIVVNWRLKKAQGSSANLIVNPDGTYLFSGDYKPAKPGKILDLVLVLKSHMGATYLFRYVANASGGGVRWSKEGKSTILREDFKLFAPGHEWAGTYGFHLTAEAAKILRRNEKNTCVSVALDVTYGGNWSFPKYCQQFNENWHN